MSEIKMIILIYAPDMDAQLTKLDQRHQALKKVFSDLDTQIGGGNDPKGASSRATSKFETGLNVLGEGSEQIKAGLIKKVQELI